MEPVLIEAAPVNDRGPHDNVIPFPRGAAAVHPPVLLLTRAADQFSALDLLRRSIALTACVLGRHPSLTAEELASARDLIGQVGGFLESFAPARAGNP
jgi:hypothetical protein